MDIEEPNLELIRTSSSLTITDHEVDLLKFASKDLRELKVLQLDTESEVVSLVPLRHCQNLINLDISGNFSGLDTIATLTKLEKLRFWDTKIPDPSFFERLKILSSLNITSCSIKVLDQLSTLQSLTHLYLRNLKSVASLSFLRSLPKLQYLQLEALSKIISIEDVIECRSLECLAMEAMNKITDFSSLLEMKGLKEFYVGNMKQGQPEDFLSLVEHPSLQKVGIFLGSDRKNNQLKSQFAARGIEFTKCSWL